MYVPLLLLALSALRVLSFDGPYLRPSVYPRTTSSASISSLCPAISHEPLPEVYGYYGRTASPPPVARGAWSATPAPEESAYGVGDENHLGSGSAGRDGSSAGVVEGVEAVKAAGDEEFVPDFGLPEGLVLPSSVRQHVMMVGTARTAVRSPQARGFDRFCDVENCSDAYP